MLQGIEAAKSVGLNPVKINVVVMRGINDEEIIDFAKLTVTEGWHVRFIELMPFAVDNPPEGPKRSKNAAQPQFMSVGEIKDRLGGLGKLEPSFSIAGNGPAKYFRLPRANGTIGFISPVSEHFCFNCNRLRLTADGKLRPCLLSDREIDLRESLRSGASPEKLRRAIIEAIDAKPRQHNLSQGSIPGNRFMSQVGG